MGKGQALYWLSMAVLSMLPLGMAIGPLGFFDGPKGE